MNCPTCGKPATRYGVSELNHIVYEMFEHSTKDSDGYIVVCTTQTPRIRDADLFHIFRQTWGGQSPDDVRAKTLLDPLLLDERQKGIDVGK